MTEPITVGPAGVANPAGVAGSIDGAFAGSAVLLAAGFAVAGLLAGWGGCRLLGRAARPAPVPIAACVVGTGALWAIAALRWISGALPGWWLPVALGVTALAVPLAAADLRYRRLPDVLTVPAYPVFGLLLGVAAVLAPEPGLGLRALAGAGLFGLVHLAAHLIAPGALGAGDVKLAGSVGGVLAAVGWGALVLAACLAALVTVVLALAAPARRAGRWRTGVPHGPGMLTAACLLSVFPGAEMTMG